MVKLVDSIIYSTLLSRTQLRMREKLVMEMLRGENIGYNLGYIFSKIVVQQNFYAGALQTGILQKLAMKILFSKAMLEQHFTALKLMIDDRK